MAREPAHVGGRCVCVTDSGTDREREKRGKVVPDATGWYTARVLRIVMLCLLVSPALADDAVKRIEVEVDNTVEVEVGRLIGFYCDRPKLIEAQMKTRKEKDRGDVNVFVVK